MLTLEIEFLSGVCFAAPSGKNPSAEPDWPPQPDRVFSALVAAWGSRGERPEEKTALEWLEQQPLPLIEATGAKSRKIGIAYVPPSDPSGRPDVLPSLRKRQQRMFPAAIPEIPLVRFRWETKPEKPALDALQSLAQDTPYLGHSASVVRCRFLLDEPSHPDLTSQSPKRAVYAGRLEELRHAYVNGERPLPGVPVALEPVRVATVTPSSVFTENWIVLEDAGGACPDLRGFAVAARILRKALIKGFEYSVPEIISGHLADHSPSADPHLAIVPLADVGFHYSSGRLMGLALVLPRQAALERDTAERDWLAGIEDSTSNVSRWRQFDRILSGIERLTLGRLGEWRIQRVLQTSKQSLSPSRYIEASERWLTVTPIALDRYPKSKNPSEIDAEIEETIASSCINVGLPKPASVKLFKHSAIKGAPSAYPSGNAPEWTGWTLPGSLANRMLTHAVIEFSVPVCGPVLLGAGRFFGLGLCLGATRDA